MGNSPIYANGSLRFIVGILRMTLILTNELNMKITTRYWGPSETLPQGLFMSFAGHFPRGRPEER